MAGKAARFAGAVGLGVAGTMAADAMLNHEDEENIFTNTVNPNPVQEPDEEIEDIVEEPEEFDPNDIMIEDVNEGVIGEVSENVDETPMNDDTIAMVDEIQPITGENLSDPFDEVAMVDFDEDIDSTLISEVELADNMNDEPFGDDTMDAFDNSDMLLADNDMLSSEPDILDDILNA